MTNKPDNKDKLRVYEYAKNLNMSSKEIITILKRQGHVVNNHMSVMENNMVHAVEQFFRDIKAGAAAKRDGGQGHGQGASVAASTPPAAAERRPAPASAPAQTVSAEQSTQQGSDQPQGDRPQAERPQQIRDDRPSQSQSGDRQGGGQSHNRGDRPQGQSQGGYNQNRGDRQGTGGGQRGPRDGSRPQGQGYQGNRPQGQGQGQGYQGNRPQGQGQGGGYQGNRPQGQGQGGGYQGNRPQGQGGGYQGNRPQGQGGQGQGQGYQGNRPQGQGQGGGYQGNRPQGQGQGGRPQGQGGFNQNRAGDRPQSQGSPARPSGDQPRPRSDQPRGDRQRPGSEGGRHDNIRSPRTENKPFRVPVHVVVDEDAILEVPPAGGVAGNKKAKPAPKRFEDNKPGGAKGGRPNNKGGKFQQRGRQQQNTVRKEKIDNTPKKIIVRGNMTVGEFAKILHKDLSEVIKKLLLMGVMATINQELDLDTIQLLAGDYGVEVELKIPEDETNLEAIEENDDPADLIERPPVVTIMGHVDHGKTTLLDAIRHTNVSEGEAGGITQHIGAYQVEINGKKITFLDTPGHEAFTSMRARGAQVTDITILVVAADDGVMPQTKEAIAHAKAAKVPIIVAVNKIDKPDSNPDRIKQELTEFELVPEEWGGDTIFANISAKHRTGLENLLEMILLVSEVQEYKANPNKRARGTVIEAELDKGKGPVARVLVQNGTLKVGDSFVAGVTFGRVRAMVNDKGKRLKEAGPSTPVEITGLTEVPQAGDLFFAFEDERKAREISDKRSIQQRQAEMGANARVTLDDLFKKIKEGEVKDLNVIIKGDVQGSVEALKGSLEKIDVEGARVKILHSGAGAITESDIILASASNAIIIGFNVRPEPAALATAEQEKVDIRLHRIIYKVIEEIESAMKGLLDPVYKETVIGQAEVRNLFKVSKVGTIAGCMVTKGKITRNSEARLIRGGIVIFEGKIDSLKRFKDDAKDVAEGYECGITLERFNDLKEGDIIEAFIMETVER